MAARSISVTIVNNTNKRLIRSASAADSGVYTVEPPSVIAAGAQGQFNMESNGFMTGAVGSASYQMEGVTGEIVMQFANPFAGKNEFKTTMPSGYTVDRTGGVGDNTTIQLTFTAL